MTATPTSSNPPGSDEAQEICLAAQKKGEYAGKAGHLVVHNGQIVHFVELIGKVTPSTMESNHNYALYYGHKQFKAGEAFHVVVFPAPKCPDSGLHSCTSYTTHASPAEAEKMKEQYGLNITSTKRRRPGSPEIQGGIRYTHPPLEDILQSLMKGSPRGLFNPGRV